MNKYTVTVEETIVHTVTVEAANELAAVGRVRTVASNAPFIDCDAELSLPVGYTLRSKSKGLALTASAYKVDPYAKERALLDDRVFFITHWNNGVNGSTPAPSIVSGKELLAFTLNDSATDGDVICALMSLSEIGDGTGFWNYGHVIRMNDDPNMLGDLCDDPSPLANFPFCNV